MLSKIIDFITLNNACATDFESIAIKIMMKIISDHIWLHSLALFIILIIYEGGLNKFIG